jgi:hypothetical protein
MRLYLAAGNHATLFVIYAKTIDLDIYYCHLLSALTNGSGGAPRISKICSGVVAT